MIIKAHVQGPFSRRNNRMIKTPIFWTSYSAQEVPIGTN